MKRASVPALMAFAASACNFPPPPNNDVDGDVDVDAGDAMTADTPDAPIDSPPPTCTGGLRVVFDDGMSPNNEVYLSGLDGSGRGPLAPHGALDYAVSGSAQGYVAFTSNRDGNVEVYRVNADGTGLVNLSMNAAPDGNPRFSRDGTKIAYARSGALWVMNTDGTNPHAVAAGNSFSPRWAPDNNTILFELSASGTESDLWIVNADGTGLRQLTSLPGLEVGASWSPNGTQVAFAGGNDVQVINADGTGRVNLTNDAALQYSASWSPDGTKVAFSEGGQIKWIAPSGGARTPISMTGTHSDVVPQWSPDGTKIMWARQPQAGTTRYAVVANADGSLATPFAGPTNYANSMDWVSCP